MIVLLMFCMSDPEKKEGKLSKKEKVVKFDEKQQEPETSNPKKTYTCADCNQVFTTSSNLKRHIKNVHIAKVVDNTLKPEHTPTQETSCKQSFNQCFPNSPVNSIFTHQEEQKPEEMEVDADIEFLCRYYAEHYSKKYSQNDRSSSNWVSGSMLKIVFFSLVFLLNNGYLDPILGKLKESVNGQQLFNQFQEQLKDQKDITESAPPSEQSLPSSPRSAS